MHSWRLDEDFPNCAPVFSCFFMEAKTSANMRIIAGDKAEYWGAVFWCEEHDRSDWKTSGR
jgi:hypothetical protein